MPRRWKSSWGGRILTYHEIYGPTAMKESKVLSEGVFWLMKLLRRSFSFGWRLAKHIETFDLSATQEFRKASRNPPDGRIAVQMEHCGSILISYMCCTGLYDKLLADQVTVDSILIFEGNISKQTGKACKTSNTIAKEQQYFFDMSVLP